MNIRIVDNIPNTIHTFNVLYLYCNQLKQIRVLRDELKSSHNSPIDIIINNTTIDEEDVMMMKVKTFMGLQKFLQQNRKCSNCGEHRSRSVLERQGCQHRLNLICTSCYSKTTWVSSSDWREPGLIRKFIESMTISGINY